MSVYLIAAPTEGLVKIGFARRPYARLSALRIGSPVEILLAAIIPGTQENERQLHARFAHQRSRGEWFFSNQEIRELILKFGVTQQSKRRRPGELFGPKRRFDHERNDQWLREFEKAEAAAEAQGRSVWPGEVERSFVEQADAA